MFSLDENEIKYHIKTEAGRKPRKKIENILPPSQVLIENIKEESRKTHSGTDYLGVITNDGSAESLIAHYARLWVIEESFRINKHTLQMRPIYHWKLERIHAHIALC